MEKPSLLRGRITIAALACAGLVILACGSSSESGKTTTSSGDTVDTAAAKALIAKYMGKPSAFPVTEPLEKAPPRGAEIAMLDIGTPVNALFWDLAQPAAKALGVRMVRVPTGHGSAQGISHALDTLIQQKPAAVIALAIDPSNYQRQFDKLRAQGAIVTDSFINNGPEHGFDTVQFGKPEANLVGKLMAAYVVAQLGGKPTEIVYYEVPEIAPTIQYAVSARETLRQLCPACNFRIVKIPIGQIGNQAPTTIVNDLRGHSKTTWALFGNDEMAVNLPPALKVAGIKLNFMGAGATPGNLQLVKTGQERATLGIDFNVMIWTILDQISREMADQPMKGLEKDGITVKQILTQEDITFDPSKGWSGYPDVADRLAPLWRGAANG